VNALTDVTGFGLAGHLIEICQGANLQAALDFNAIPKLEQVDHYLNLGCIPGGTERNYESYQQNLPVLSDYQKAILCDPQTSGGLLVAVNSQSESALIALLNANFIDVHCIGQLQQGRLLAPSANLINLIEHH